MKLYLTCLFLFLSIVSLNAQINKFPKLEQVSITHNFNIGRVLNDNNFDYNKALEAGISYYQQAYNLDANEYFFIASGVRFNNGAPLGVSSSLILSKSSPQIFQYSIKSNWRIDKTNFKDYLEIGISRILLIDRSVAWLIKESNIYNIEVGKYIAGTWVRRDFQFGLDVSYNFRIFKNKIMSVYTQFGLGTYLSSDAVWSGNAGAWGGIYYNDLGEPIGYVTNSFGSSQVLHSQKSKVLQANTAVKLVLLPRKRINGIIAYNNQFGIQNIGENLDFTFDHWIYKQFFEFGLSYGIYKKDDLYRF